MKDDVEFLLARLDEINLDDDTDDLIDDWNGHVEPAIARLRAALVASQKREETQEPVAYRFSDGGGYNADWRYSTYDPREYDHIVEESGASCLGSVTPLYASPVESLPSDTPVKKLGGDEGDLRRVLWGVLELFGVEGCHKVTTYALEHRRAAISPVIASGEEADADASVTKLEAELAQARKALETFQTYGCPICGGDCGSANPPVMGCPMQEAHVVLDTSRDYTSWADTSEHFSPDFIGISDVMRGHTEGEQK